MRVNRRTVLGGLVATAATPLMAAPGSAKPLIFLVVGDWGRDGAQHQRDVANAMGQAAEGANASFIISVGDNFYEDGVQSAVDPQWQSSFESIYTAPSLQVPWIVALGNHDYRGRPQAQLDYMQLSTRWKMPSRYYRVSGSSFGAAQVELFVIDTSPLVHSYREKVEEPIAKNVARQNPETQLAWLDGALAQSTAQVKLVIGHHTIRSGGSAHGDTPELVQRVLPLLQKHRVTAYINGHDHDLQHIRSDGMDFFCCGAGSEVRPVRPIAGTRFCAARSGFAQVSVKGYRVATSFRDYMGAELYHSEVAPAALAA